MKAFDFDQVITHSTVFHADDVFGVALCRLINPLIEVIRTLDNDIEKYLEAARNVGKNVIVFDIGRGEYDHHQIDKKLRDEECDGKKIPYCGFGLLWKDFGYLLCPEKEAWDRVDKSLVLPIDMADNGVGQNLLSYSIKTLNPNWDDENLSENVAFHRAMNVAMIILKGHIDHARSSVAAKEKILSLVTDSRILVMDKYMSWNYTVVNEEKCKDILFVVYPSMRGGWNVETVQTDRETHTNRMNFPEDWLGHADPDRGIKFAHTGNFLIACYTKEQAIQVAKDAIAMGGISL